MLTIESLQALGANTEEGLGRCMGNEALYLRLVNMAAGDKNFDILENAMETRDRESAFEAAHALKGVLGNLSLTPLFESASALTELLRNVEEIPAESAPLLLSLKENLEKLRAIL